MEEESDASEEEMGNSDEEMEDIGSTTHGMRKAV